MVFQAWVIYKEANWISSAVWVVLLCCFGRYLTPYLLYFISLSFVASFCASILLFDWMSLIDLMVSTFFLFFYLFSAATCAYIVKKLFEVTSVGSSQDPLDLLFIR